MSDGWARTGAIGRFAAGFGYPFRGAAFLARRPRLWGWVALPIAILGVLLLWAAAAIVGFVPGFVDGIVPRPPGGAAEAAWLVLVWALGLALFAVAAVVLWALSSVVSTPFYDMLSEKVEAELTGREGPPFEWKRVLGDAAVSIVHTLVALGVYLVLSVVVFAIGLIPVVGAVIGPVLGALLTTTFLARELLDVPMARQRLAFGTKLDVLWQHLAAMEGLGAAAALMLAIPGLNLLSMPVAVVGATMMWCEHIEPTRRGGGSASEMSSAGS